MRVLVGEPGVDRDAESLYGRRRTAPPGRPWVVANMVAGLDGSAAVGGRVAGLSSSRDRELFVLLRSIADVVLVGAGTVRAERYGPVRLTPEQRQARAGRGQAELPPIAVVSRSLQLDFDAPLFAVGQGPTPMLITVSTAGEPALESAHRHADVIIAGDDRVDLAVALGALAERDCHTVLTEGGPSLLSELIDDDLLDELCLTLAPVVGGDPLPIARATGGGLHGFELASVLEESSDLFLRYLAVRP
jgi:riboflavin biosynthesis pyrimidine reductase